jgi:predicted ester cyclase
MTNDEANKAAVRGCFERGTKGQFERLHEVVNPAYVLHPDEVRGIEGLTELVKGYRSALADLRVTIDHQFSEGDYVATRSTIHGRHEGELMGAAPTGREVTFTCVTISRCRDGRIEEEWELADTAGLMAQVAA